MLVDGGQFPRQSRHPSGGGRLPERSSRVAQNLADPLPHRRVEDAGGDAGSWTAPNSRVARIAAVDRGVRRSCPRRIRHDERPATVPTAGESTPQERPCRVPVVAGGGGLVVVSREITAARSWGVMMGGATSGTMIRSSAGRRERRSLPSLPRVIRLVYAS